jgi:chromosome segregation ATPase
MSARSSVELDRLKIERERLGAVNLRAEEEQKELSDKLDAMLKEREDIIDAIRKLRSAIQNLNREGRERLLGRIRHRQRPVPAAVLPTCSAAARPNCN